MPELDPKWVLSVLDSLKDGFIATDKKGAIVKINAVAQAILGAKSKEVLGKSLNATITIGDIETGTAIHIPSPRAFFRKSDPRTYPRVLLLSGQNTDTILEAMLLPIKGYRGAIEGSMLVFRDISDAIREEQAVLEAHRMEAIGAMAGSLAMDFGNWLSLISGHASSVADNVIQNTRAHDEALRILDAVQQAEGLTKRLLSIASVGSNDMDAETEIVDLASIVERAVELMTASFAERKITFDVRKMGSAPYVRSNSRQLLDCLMCLFLNAADAMPSGGTISLDISTKRNKDKPRVVLRVKDTGEGIARKHLTKIFEPFFSTRDPASSVGLGLTVVQTMLQRWDGTIRVQSRKGQGTSFRIFLPKEKISAEEKKRRSGGETILVADDQQHDLDELTGILQESGYKVLAANGGEKCVDLYRKRGDEVSLCIIDVVMPDRDGKYVLEEVLKMNPTAPVVMVSGFSREYLRGHLERGAWGFAQKPFDRKQLLSAVRRTLDKSTGKKTEKKQR